MNRSQCTFNNETTFILSITDDDASPIHVHEVETTSGTANFTLKYPSQTYSARSYTMAIRVYTKWIFGRRHEIAYDNINYEITKQLNGEMKVTQGNRTIKEGRRGAIISTKTNTKVEIDLYDPYCKYYFVNISVSEDKNEYPNKR
jgi:hypothetical protein